MRHHRLRGGRVCKPLLIGGPRAPRVPRLRLRRHLAGRGGRARRRPRRRQPGQPEGGRGHERLAGHDRGSATPAGPPTAGRPEENAHPLIGCDDRFSVVLNGIVENYVALKQQLIADGHVFSSETDAEVVAHLLETHYDGDLVEAVRLTFLDLHGHYAFCVVSPLHPETIVGARLQCPMVIGLGEGETFVASDIVAFLADTREVKMVGDGELVVVTPRGRGAARPRRAARSSAPRDASRGTPPPPRRAATRPSCSRRSTSSPTRCARPSASGCRAARSGSTRASPTSSCARSTAS